MESLQPKILEIQGMTHSEIKFIKLSGGQTHYAAIDNNGKLYTWGDG